METQVWFRNPDMYIRELVETGEYKIAWDRGLLVKKRIDPKKHADLYFGRTYPYRILLVGEQGSAELRQDSTFDAPTAVYPTWLYGEEQSLLEEMISRPAGAEMSFCLDTSIPPDERPVWGQEHRVVISQIPNLTTGPGRKFLRYLKELQEEYPDCIIHLHGSYSHRLAFGMNFGAADTSPREAAQKGKIILPSGKEVKYEHAAASPQWVSVLGFKPIDLEVPRNRCMFNIKSAVWAGENYNKLFNFRVQSSDTPDIESSDDSFTPPTTGKYLTLPIKAKDGDKQVCNTCSLQTSCKYYRDGSVCTVPGAENKKLADFFNTRSSDLIIDGLGALMAANTRRLERSLNEEENFGETNSEVTKMLGQVFGQGVQLAKLIDPSLSGARVQVNVGVGQGGVANVSTADPKQLVAQVFRELESRGIRREDITSEMVQGLLSSFANPDTRERAIQGVVVESKAVNE